MCAENVNSKPSLILSILSNKCPRCRQGKLFINSNPYSIKNSLTMPERCPVCGQKYELQTGFYFGTGFVSYGISVAILGVIFTAWAMTIGFSFRDNSVFQCLGISIAILLVLQPLLQRLARSIWIACFVRYDANWRTDKGSPKGSL
jgi:uncharacterized protein (DUF983 family)